MGIFGRISDMVSAKVNGAIDEMENPLELLDQKVRNMQESLNDAKKASASVLGNIKQTEKKMNEALEASQDWDKKVAAAMTASDKALEAGNEEIANKNKDLARQALQKKREYDQSYQTLKAALEGQKKQGEVLKKKLRDLEEETEKARNYRDEAAARLANAEAGQKVGEIMANVETKTNRISMDSIERKISRKETMADGLMELAGDDDTLESQIDALGAVDLDDELEKYRKK